MNRMYRPVALLASSALAIAALAGCAAGGQAESTATPTSDAAVQTIEGLEFQDMWIKATDSDMTGVFGTIRNTTDAPITLKSVKYDNAGMTEFHETIIQSDGSSVMQAIQTPPVIEPGAEWTLKPGDDHIMLMKLDAAINPGDEIKLTLELGDGSEIEFAATAREYTGGKETYSPEGDHSGHGGMDHGGMDHGDASHMPESTEHAGH